MKLNTAQFAQLIENYANHIIDGMDSETMESMVYDLLVREYETYTEEQIVGEIEELYGDDLLAELMPVPAAPSAPKKKLSYNEQREFDGMEAAIAAAEKKHADLETRLNDPSLVADHAAYAKACDAAGTAQAEIARLYARWEELEQKRN